MMLAPTISVAKTSLTSGESNKRGGDFFRLIRGGEVAGIASEGFCDGSCGKGSDFSVVDLDAVGNFLGGDFGAGFCSGFDLPAFDVARVFLASDFRADFCFGFVGFFAIIGLSPSDIARKSAPISTPIEPFAE